MTACISKKIASFSGEAQIPGDKSISHRALMFGAVGDGETTISGLLEGEDVLKTVAALRAMGVQVTEPKGRNKFWRIQGLGKKDFCQPKDIIDLGNSGTSVRLLMGLVAGYPIDVQFRGDASLSRRPMARVTDPLGLMGAQFNVAEGGCLPLVIKGRDALNPIEYTLPIASAQVKSAILLAALRAKGKTTVIEPKPTRDHTEKMLRAMGASVETNLREDGSSQITIEGYPDLKPLHVDVPRDPSSAAFITVAALITKGAEVFIPNILMNPRRAGIYDTLIEMGANITFENKREVGSEPVVDLRVLGSVLKGIKVPANRVPSMIDEFPILSIAASFAQGKTVMTGLSELRVKESDRLLSIFEGLRAAGIQCEMGEESLVIEGMAGLSVSGGCEVKTHLDHRIAMSFLILGMQTEAPIQVDHAESILTSFPAFISLMNHLGANIQDI